MDALRPGGCGEGAGADWSAGTPEIHARILRVCLAQGLLASDAQDVAQEIFVWLSQTARSEAADVPWVSAVAENFVRRYIRRRAIRTARESSAAAERAARPSRDGIEALESKLVLDKLEKSLPLNEAKLLHLIRHGCTFREAVRALAIPRGSWSYFERRLVGHLKEGLGAGKRPVRTA
jgi:DNA-directed RNA polymerase specialized sigma24 family protein